MNVDMDHFSSDVLSDLCNPNSKFGKLVVGFDAHSAACTEGACKAPCAWDTGVKECLSPLVCDQTTQAAAQCFWYNDASCGKR
eukprot:gene28046-40685_t